MSYTGSFIPVKATEVRVSNRQVPIGMQLRSIHKCMCRTIHWFHAKFSLIDICKVHIVSVIIIMARSLPKIRGKNLWGNDLLISVEFVKTPDVTSQSVIKRGTFRQEEGACRRNRIKQKQL